MSRYSCRVITNAIFTLAGFCLCIGLFSIHLLADNLENALWDSSGEKSVLEFEVDDHPEDIFIVPGIIQEDNETASLVACPSWCFYLPVANLSPLLPPPKSSSVS
jgi:hypothetical protein